MKAQSYKDDAIVDTLSFLRLSIYCCYPGYQYIAVPATHNKIAVNTEVDTLLLLFVDVKTFFLIPASSDAVLLLGCEISVIY